jgi:hypothetical protein
VSLKCKCSVGTYFDSSAASPTESCALCPANPEPCSGPDAEDEGIEAEFTIFGEHRTRHIHGVCVVETDTVTGFVVVESNSANFFTVDTSSDPKFTHSKYIPLDGEPNIKIGKCKHLGEGQVIMSSTIARQFNIDSTDKTRYT